jgi:hypothetical protein
VPVSEELAEVPVQNVSHAYAIGQVVKWTTMKKRRTSETLAQVAGYRRMLDKWTVPGEGIRLLYTYPIDILPATPII